MIASLFRRTAALSLATAAATAMAAALTAGPSLAATTPTPPAPGIAPGSTTLGDSSSPVNVLAYTATDGSVWLKDLATGSYAPADGHLISAPSVISDDGTHIEIFGRGTNSALWMTTCTLSVGCSGWTSAGGVITSKPGAAAEGTAGYYDVFARGADGALWRIVHGANGWGSWMSWGGRLLSGTGPAAVYDPLLDPEVLVVGTNKQLYERIVGLGTFESIGGQTTVSPALVRDVVVTPTGGVNGLVAFARGTDGAAWFSLPSSTPDWHSMGGQFSTGLSATAAPLAARASEVPTTTFGLGTDNRVYADTGTWTSYPPTFTGWTPVS